MKRKLLIVGFSMLFAAGVIAQKNNNVYSKSTPEEMSSNKYMPDKDETTLYGKFANEELGERGTSINDQNDYNQQQSSPNIASSQAGGSWYESFNNGNLGNFKVIKGGDPNSFFYSKKGGRGIKGTGCVWINYHPNIAHDDYLVTPAMTTTSKSYLTFWAKNGDGDPFNEEFDVLLSTTGTNKADFKVKLAEKVSPGRSYQKYEYDLGKYAGQTVYVAIHNKTTSRFRLLLDDFTFEALSAHDLKVTTILPDVVVSGKGKIPSVTIYNQGINEESNWKVKLTDGKSYTHENTTPGKIGSRKSVTLKFPKWSPTDPSSELTATVTITGDTDVSNNSLKHKVPVVTLQYTKGTIYALDTKDNSPPTNMDGDIVKIDKNTAALTTIKKTSLAGIYTGDFVGSGDKKELIAIDGHQRVFLINGNGDSYYHHKITNLNGGVMGVTWDPVSKAIYVNTYEAPNAKLYKLDENYRATFVGNIFTTKKNVRTIASDENGELFGLTADGTLYRINKKNAKTTLIGNIGVNIAFAQEMGFDKGSGLLYATLYKNLGQVRSGGLYILNTNTGKAEQIGKDYKDHVILLGTFGDPLPKKDLSVEAITPSFVASGHAVNPRVTIKNFGGEAQTNWSVRLVDGKGYDKTIANKINLKRRNTTTITFPDWSPAEGPSKLTATVILNGDAVPSNNTAFQNVVVKKLTYSKETLYAYNLLDQSDPFDMTNHVVKVDMKTAKITSLKATNLKNVYAGDFVGVFDKTVLMGLTNHDSKVHVFDQNGNVYYYKTITGIPDRLTGFTWDQSSNKIYVVTVGQKPKLYELDKNFKGIYKGTFKNGNLLSIACDSKGNLYGLGLNDNLYKISKSNAKATAVGNLGINVIYAQGIGFDRTNGVLYGTLFKETGNGGLYTIDTESGKATQIKKDFKDELVILGVYGNPLPKKDLSVEAITPKFVPGGLPVNPQVVIRNNGLEAQTNWSVRLVDGKGYDKTVTNKNKLNKVANTIISFPDWTPTVGSSTLTATVILAGDAVKSNNVASQKVNVRNITYSREKIYAINLGDFSKPFDMTSHIVTVDLKTAKISSLKKTTFTNMYAGDFVGVFSKTILMGINYDDKKVYIIDEKGNAYYYKTLAGIPEEVNGFAWDQSSNKIYVSTMGKETKLYELDKNFKGILKGSFKKGDMLNIACDSKGNLYALGLNDQLYKIDKTNAKATHIGSLGIDVSSAQGIGFDRTNDVLYGTLYIAHHQGGLYTISTKTGTATRIKEDFKDELVLLGVYGKASIKATDFEAFSFAEQANRATINTTDHKIDITVNPGTDVTKLVATFTLSEGATAKVGNVVQVSGTTSNDFTKPVTYTVTAKDGNTKQDWVVTVTVGKSKSNKTDFTTFSFVEQAKDATINTTDHKIDITVKPGTDVTKLKATFTLSKGATAKVGDVVQVSGTTGNNYAKPVIYKVTAEDGKTSQNWTVTVNVKETPTSIEEDISKHGIAIYPNPSTGIFNVEVKEPYVIEVIDVKGKVVLKRELIGGTINVKLKHSGIYFINFTNDKTSLTQRIVVSQ